MPTEKSWDRLFDFFFMLSLLLPSRVAVGLKAVLGSLIDKWEHGCFLDEIIEGLSKPFIKPDRFDVDGDLKRRYHFN